MESKGQMVIFYEGCRIIKVNEQVSFGGATFSRREADGVTMKTDVTEERAGEGGQAKYFN